VALPPLSARFGSAIRPLGVVSMAGLGQAAPVGTLARSQGGKGNAHQRARCSLSQRHEPSVAASVICIRTQPQTRFRTPHWWPTSQGQASLGHASLGQASLPLLVPRLVDGFLRLGAKRLDQGRGYRGALMQPDPSPAYLIDRFNSVRRTSGAPN
jgi:hypothetical protein